MSETEARGFLFAAHSEFDRISAWWRRCEETGVPVILVEPARISHELAPGEPAQGAFELLLDVKHLPRPGGDALLKAVRDIAKRTDREIVLDEDRTIIVRVPFGDGGPFPEEPTFALAGLLAGTWRGSQRREA